MDVFQEKSPAGHEALNKISYKNSASYLKKKQLPKLQGDTILFEYYDECGVLRKGFLDSRYKRLVKYLHSMGNTGATVWDATYSHHRLRYITQIIHIIRVDKGFGFNFITTELEEVGEGCKSIARYRLNPSFRIIAESEV